MFDPNARRLNDGINVMSRYIIPSIFTVVAIPAGIIATPFALMISAVALPILYFQRYPIHADLKWLTKEMKQIHGETFPFGRIKGQDYRKKAPQNDSDKFIFNTIEDLSWLWHEHHRCNTEKQLIKHDETISFYWHLTIPIIGIYVAKLGNDLNNDNSSLPDDRQPALVPKGTIQSHFVALKQKLYDSKALNPLQYNQAQLSSRTWKL